MWYRTRTSSAEPALSSHRRSSSWKATASVGARTVGRCWRSVAPVTTGGTQLVNDSQYGLSAAVFTDGLGAVDAAVERLEVGMCHINSETAGADPHVPFDDKTQWLGPDGARRAGGSLPATTTVYLRGSQTGL